MGRHSNSLSMFLERILVRVPLHQKASKQKILFRGTQILSRRTSLIAQIIIGTSIAEFKLLLFRDQEQGYFKNLGKSLRTGTRHIQRNGIRDSCQGRASLVSSENPTSKPVLLSTLYPECFALFFSFFLL